jgi:hypothetical protein
MNESLEARVSGLARVRDEDLAGWPHSEGARTLLAGLLAEPPPRRVARTRRLILVAAAVVAVTAGAVAVPGMLGTGTVPAASYRGSAIDVVREGDFFVARIKDPLADSARYAEAFRALGKDVDIELVPVSPKLVGRVLQASLDGAGQASTDLVPTGTGPVDCVAQPGRCTLVVRISADTTGPVRYLLGRSALPGESYQDGRGGN